MTKENMTDNSRLPLSRREIFKKTGLGAAAITLAGMGLSVSPAMVEAQATLTTWLNYTHRIAALQQEFYRMALLTVSDFSAPDSNVVTTIKAHKDAHVTSIAAMSGAGSVVAAGTLDLSGNNVWGTELAPTSVTTRANFFQAAQLLEDMGVRIQKAAMGEMLGHASLETMFRIHSVWGMDAGMIRRLANTTAWVSTTVSGTPAAGTLSYLQQLTYGGPTANASTEGVVTNEDNRFQLSNAISTASQWFDEPAQLAAVAASGTGSTAKSAQPTSATAFLTEFDAI